MNTLFESTETPAVKPAKADKQKKKAKAAKRPKGTAVAIHQPQAAPPVKQKPGKPEAMNLMAIIASAARDPLVDPAKMRELLAIRKELKQEESAEAFTVDLIKAQAELPSISRRGRIEIEGKNGRAGQSTPYAKFEDINRVVKPILQKHGFTITFKTDSAADLRISVTAILKHKAGHEQESTLVLPLENSGSKNNVQGVGSAVSYGKRYCMTALLNLIAEGDDDDGNLGAGEPINSEQLTELIEAADAAGVDKRKFCDHFKIKGMAELPARRFHEALGMIAQRAKAAAKK